MQELKKPKFVRKYDYFRTFYRPKEHWLWPTYLIDQEVQKLIDEECKKQKKDLVFEQLLDDEEVVEDDSNIDIKETYNELKLSQNNTDSNEDDPKIIEGKILDIKSKEFIVEEYFGCKVIDFDDKEYSFISPENLYNKTIQIIKNENNVILFQPTFIAKNIAINKPDALIKINDEIHLIETKGTTKVKSIHFLDFLYQDRIINFCLKENKIKPIDKYFLCLVAVCKANKNEIIFTLTENLSFTKTGSTNGQKTLDELTENGEIEKYSDEYYSEKQKININEHSEKDIKTYFDYINSSEKEISDQKIKKCFISAYNEIQFWNTINKIYTHKIHKEISFYPNGIYKSDFKDNDSFPLINSYYKLSKKYKPFGFSGKLFKFCDAISSMESFNQTKDYSDFDQLQVVFNKKLEKKQLEKEKNKKQGKEIKGTFEQYFELFQQNKEKKIYFTEASKIFFKNNIQNRKIVYFDFESLNLAIRVVDKTPPFMQVVNQVSVIRDDLSKPINKLKCNNLVIDPLKIQIKDFELIIDTILDGVDNISDYKYAVYNKSFEQTRLIEMAYLIGKKEYINKVKEIIINMIDLADMFVFKKKENTSICIWDVRGFYSIKIILDKIMKIDNDVFKETGCLNYKELNVQNGTQAQLSSTLRFFNKLSDKQWTQKVKDLKEYCENDVRAMIAVKVWIEKNLERK